MVWNFKVTLSANAGIEMIVDSAQTATRDTNLFNKNTP
jgi:hypothetical protein